MAVLLLLLMAPRGVLGTPAGKVIVAQGVDPSTLDVMNHQETPVNVVTRHIFDKLVLRV